MKAKCFITFIVLTSMLGWVAVTVSAANGAGDGKSRGSGGSNCFQLQSHSGMSSHQARQADSTSPIIKVYNMSGKSIWMYNLNPPYAIYQSKGIEIISSNNPTIVTLDQTTNTTGKNRIYFVESSEFVDAPSGVDAFNPGTNQDNVPVNSFLNYTYVEYTFAEDSGVLKYSIDVSYVDEWSLPVQMKFYLNGNTTWGKADDKFVYGFKSFDTVANILRSSVGYAGLVWSGGTPWGPQPPNTLHRIIGPNKVWQQQYGVYPGTMSSDPNFCMCDSAWVPISYSTFVCGNSTLTSCSSTDPGTGIPWNAYTYSTTMNNRTFWFNDLTGPISTPYPMALHQAAVNDGGGCDSKGKFGFFTYPNDNVSAEFTFIPTTVDLDLYVYGSGNDTSSSVIPGRVWRYSSSVAGAVAPVTIDSDLDNDIDTDSTDLSLMLLAMSVYPPASEPGPEDLNKDGVLDNTDLGLVFLHFGY